MTIRVLLLGHKPEDLETVLRSFVQREGGNLTSSQHEGRQRYQFLLQQYIHVAPENDDLLLEYYNAFNECFFFGSLKSLCKVQFFSPESMQEVDGCCCHDSPDVPDNFMCLIMIGNKADENRNLSNETRLRDYLGTLLHEMLHAFFDIYTCRFDAQSMRIQHPGLGVSGHACAWQNSALSLEDATANLYGGRLDLGRMTGVDTEFDESGQSPLQEDLDYWRLQWRR